MEIIIGLAVVAVIGYFIWPKTNAEATVTAEAPYKVETPVVPADVTASISETAQVVDSPAAKAPAKKAPAKKPAAKKAPAKKPVVKKAAAKPKKTASK